MATFQYSDEHGMVMDEIPADRGRLYIRVMPRAIAPHILLHEFDEVGYQASCQGYQAIHHAAARGDVPALKRLIAAGHDKNAIQQSGIEADPDVKWTLDDRIYRFISGATPLHLAAFYGHVNAVDALIKAGANVNVTAGARAGENIDRGYVTPLYLALQEDHHDAACLLYIHGAQVIEDRGEILDLDVPTIALTDVVGVSEEWPQLLMDSLIAFENYSPLSVIEPHTLRLLMSTPQFSSWLEGHGNRYVFCKEVYGCALSRVLSHHVQLTQHYMDSTTDQSEPIRRMLKILEVLADFDLIIPRLLLEPFGKRLVVANSYLGVGGSIIQEHFMFTSMDLLFIFGGLAMFGVFPSPKNRYWLMRKSVKAFAKTKTHNMRMDILKFIEALLTYLRLPGCHDAGLVKKVNAYVDKKVETFKKKAADARADISRVQKERTPEVNANLDNTLSLLQYREALKLVKSHLRDLKLLSSVLTRGEILLKPLYEMAGQANVMSLGSPQGFLAQKIHPLQLPPFVCLLWCQIQPTSLYNARKQRSLTEAKEDQMLSRRYLTSFPAVLLYLRLQGLSQVPQVEDNFESDYSTDDNGSDMEEEAKEKVGDGQH